MKRVFMSAILVVNACALDGCSSVKANSDDARRTPAGSEQAAATESAVRDAITTIHDHIDAKSLTTAGMYIGLTGFAMVGTGILIWRHGGKIAAREGALAADDAFEIADLVFKVGQRVIWTGAGISIVGAAIGIYTALKPTPAHAAEFADQFKSPAGLKRFFALTPEQQFQVARWDGQILQMLIQLGAAIKSTEA